MAATSSPPKRLLPGPIEPVLPARPIPEASHASQDDPVPLSDIMTPATKPKRALPQPIEESTRSSHKSKAERAEVMQDGSSTESHSQINDGPQPALAKTRPPQTAPRRFAPEPVETSTKSSRRKFVPEPVETSARSSKEKKKDKEGEKEKEREQSPSAKPRRKFLPEPVETSARSGGGRRRKAEGEDDTTTQKSPSVASSPPSTSPPSRTSSGGRKFSPELLETAKGSYRRGQAQSASAVPKHLRTTSPSPPPTQEPAHDAPAAEESRFSAAALCRKQHEENRQHSFMVPKLAVIESDESDEESAAPSLTNSPSSVETDQRQSTHGKGNETSYTDYVFRLAAQTAQKELQEQAMAAYINERPHEPVDHFAFDHDEDDGPIPVGKFSSDHGVDIRTFRRSSAADLDWEMENMRKHHEQLEQVRREFREDTAGQSRFSAAALASRHHIEAAKKPRKARAGQDEDPEMSKMRAAASPPMLGDDLVFPYTISPKRTRCDVDQAPRPRTADSDDEKTETEGDVQLWTSNAQVLNAGGAGLWMGLCQRGASGTSQTATPSRSGIQTPAVEAGHPFESRTPGRGTRTPGGRKTPRPWTGMAFVPLTPPRSADGQVDSFTSTIDRKLNLERQIEEEFPNSVVTQIYNYLSLGYPSLAHGFDDELSKISRIPIDDLRRDDGDMDVRGYVGTPEREGAGEADGDGRVRCKRWEALRLYIREWARQSPNFQHEHTGVATGKRGGGGHGKGGGLGAGGIAVRKGSWAH